MISLFILQFHKQYVYYTQFIVRTKRIKIMILMFQSVYFITSSHLHNITIRHNENNKSEFIKYVTGFINNKHLKVFFTVYIRFMLSF